MIMGLCRMGSQDEPLPLTPENPFSGACRNRETSPTSPFAKNALK